MPRNPPQNLQQSKSEDEMSGRLSPTMDVNAELLNESPEGSPTGYSRRRASINADYYGGADDDSSTADSQPKNLQQQQQQQQQPEEQQRQELLQQQQQQQQEKKITPVAVAHQPVDYGTNSPISSGAEMKSGGNSARFTAQHPPSAAAATAAMPDSPDDQSHAVHTGSLAHDDDEGEDPETPARGKSRHEAAASGGHGVPARQPRTCVAQLSTDVYESLNYDEVENEVLHEERVIKGGDLDPSHWKVWLILILCGAITGIIAFGIDRGQHALSVIKFKAVEHFLQSENPEPVVPGGDNGTTSNTTTTAIPPLGQTIYHSDPRSVTGALFIFLGINLAYVAVAAAVVVFGEPVAKGSGIPEVKCYLNGVRIWRVVRLKTMIVKASGILFAVASGLPVGKEGPMIHSGSAIASGISQGKSSLLKWDTGFFREFRTDAYKRAFITAGAAAGVGAAFGAPIGGIIFAVEEVCSFWNLELTVMVFLCAASSPWTLQILMHPDGLTSGKVNGLIDFGLVTGSYNYQDIPFLMLLGIASGGLGAIFIWINLIVTRWRKEYVNTKGRKFAEVMIISFAVSMVLICLVLFGYRCVDIGGANENTRSYMKRYGCGEGQFNDMATYFFTDLERSINLLIHEPRAIHLGSLAKQFFPYFILTSITYGINVPSGLFLPSLALGANFGHMFAQIINLCFGDQFVDPAKFALYGGTGMLAGNLRMTISVVAIVMEATGNATLFYPLAIITICAKFFGDIFNHGIFDEHIHLAKIPLLESKNPQPAMATMTAGQIMNKHPVRLPPTCSVRVLLHVLKHYPLHNTYMVCDGDTGVFKGMLPRRTALILIDREAWKEPLSFEHFARTEKERKYISVKKYGVLNKPVSDDMEQVVDLMRYADRWPHVFPTSTPVPRVYRTFRELGLRHIIIVDDKHRPVGLIGRRQLCFLDIHRDGPVSPAAILGGNTTYDPTQSSKFITTTGLGEPGIEAPLAYQDFRDDDIPTDEDDDDDPVHHAHQQSLLPLRDRDVRRSRLSNLEWHDTSVPEK